jgi:hypothetical protein
MRPCYTTGALAPVSSNVYFDVIRLLHRLFADAGCRLTRVRQCVFTHFANEFLVVLDRFALDHEFSEFLAFLEAKNVTKKSHWAKCFDVVCFHRLFVFTTLPFH